MLVRLIVRCKVHYCYSEYVQPALMKKLSSAADTLITLLEALSRRLGKVEDIQGLFMAIMLDPCFRNTDKAAQVFH